MVGNNKKCLIVIILAVLAVMVAAIGDAHQTPPPYPVREEAVIHNGDRLMASWLEGMFGVLYNWTQKAHLILSDMLYNGNGVASITADLITAKNKLVTPLVDATNITLSGTVRASAVQSDIVRTADTITTRLTASSASVLGTLEASNISAGSLNTQNFDALRLKTDAVLFDKSTTPTLSGADSAIYYDATLDRYRMFTGGQWRDLTSQVTISSTTIGAPLKVEGWVEADNVKSLGKVEAQHLKGLDIELGYDGILSTGSEDIASCSVATINLGTIPNESRFGVSATITRNITVEREPYSVNLGMLQQAIEINTTTSVGSQVREANIASIRYLSNNATPTLNLSTNLSAKNVSLESLSVNTNINAANSSLNDLNVYQKLKIPVYSSSSSIASPTKGNLYFNSSSNKLNAYNGTAWEEVGTTINIDDKMIATSTNPVQNKVVKSYIDSNGTTTLNSAKSYADTKDTATLNSAKNYVDGKLSSGTQTINVMNINASGTINSADINAQNTLKIGRLSIYDASGNPETIVFDYPKKTGMNDTRIEFGSPIWREDINPDIYTYGSLISNGDFLAEKDATIGGDVVIGGDLLARKDATIDGDVVIGGDLLMSSGSNIAADYIVTNKFGALEWLSLPMSSSASAPTGSIGYNALLHQLLVKDGTDWLNMTGANITKQQKLSAKKVKYHDGGYSQSENLQTDVYLLGDKIVIWVIPPYTELGFEGDIEKIYLDIPEELLQCSLYSRTYENDCYIKPRSNGGIRIETMSWMFWDDTNTKIMYSFGIADIESGSVSYKDYVSSKTMPAQIFIGFK